MSFSSKYPLFPLAMLLTYLLLSCVQGQGEVLSAAVDSPPTPTLPPTADGGLSDPETVLNIAPLPLPPFNTAVTEPTFGTTLRRITNSFPNGQSSYHLYSQLQVFSPDMNYLLLAENGNYVVRHFSDLSNMPIDPSSWNAPRWWPAQPHSIIHYDSNEDTTLRVQATDVQTGQTTTLFTFPSTYTRILGAQSFDELSRNGRWMAGMAQTQTPNQNILFALDLQTMTLGAQIDVDGLYGGACQPDPEWGNVRPDWVGVSPLGNYLVVQWVRDGVTRCSGFESFDLTTGAFIGRAYEGHAHSDMGVAADGQTEYLVVFELEAAPPNQGNSSVGLRLLPGTQTISPPIYLQPTHWNNGHISCQGPDGVCLISMWTDESNGWSPREGELVLQYFDGSLLRLAHHRSSQCGYWNQPRASLSHNGRYIVFDSDWYEETGANGCDNPQVYDLGRADVFLIDLGYTPPVYDHMVYLPMSLR
ncbi:MAG: hypothetical protein OT477_17435 [Chloroflexi bacterium]|nr:hypothetical protein [Chloroflexota bacterium]